MIISATRIPTVAGPRGLADHVWRGKGNRHTRTIQGAERELQTMVSLARAGGRKFAIRHYHISPGEACTDQEMMEVVHALANEFGFDVKHAVVVEHGKARLQLAHPGAGDPPFQDAEPADEHWHIMVPEVNPITKKVLSSSWMRPRHEKLARLFEARFGHKIIKGKFNSSVLKTLEEEGLTGEKKTLELAGIQHGTPAFARYESKERRQFERQHPDFAQQNRSFNELTAMAAKAWTESRRRVEFKAKLENLGMRMRQGDSERGSPSFIIEAYSPTSKEWVFLGALHRLAQIKKRDVTYKLTEWEANNEREQQKADKGKKNSTVGATRDAGLARGSTGTQGPAGSGFQGPDPSQRRDSPISDKLRRIERTLATARDRWTGPAGAPACNPGSASAPARGHRDEVGNGNPATYGTNPKKHIPKARLSEPEPVASPRFTDEDRERARCRVAAAQLRRLAGAPEARERLRRLKDSFSPGRDSTDQANPCTITPAKAELGERRRARYRLMLLKRAYGLEGQWLPDDQVQHIRRVDWNAQRGWVILTLLDGTRIRDSGNQVALLGKVTSDAVQELVAAVLRRHASDPATWAEVRLTGSREFQRAAALLLIRSGVAVVDPPLDDGEIALARQLGGLERPLRLKARPNPSAHLNADLEDVPSPGH